MVIAWSSIFIVLFAIPIILWMNSKENEFNPEKIIAESKKAKKSKSIFKNGLFWFGIFGISGIFLLIID